MSFSRPVFFFRGKPWKVSWLPLLSALALTTAAASPWLSTHLRRELAERAKARAVHGILSEKAPVRPAFKPDCVLAAIAARRRRTVDPAKPKPAVLFESETPLSRFQDAVEEQWGQRPDVFTNAYAWKKNEIFLIDDGTYYSSLHRTIDDSLAHEYVHYLQVVYEGSDISQDAWGVYENEAIDAQTWFRQEGAAALGPECRSD